MAVLFDAFSLLQLNPGSKPGDKGRRSCWWMSSYAHKVPPSASQRAPLQRQSVLGGSHLIVTPLYGEGETDFYSIWMPNDGSRNWPCSHSPSSLGAGQEASLTIGKGRTASAFSKPLSVYLTVKKHKEARWALVPHLKNVAHGSALYVYVSSAAL